MWLCNAKGKVGENSAHHNENGVINMPAYWPMALYTSVRSDDGCNGEFHQL